MLSKIGHALRVGVVKIGTLLPLRNHPREPTETTSVGRLITSKNSKVNSTISTNQIQLAQLRQIERSFGKITILGALDFVLQRLEIPIHTTLTIERSTVIKNTRLGHLGTTIEAHFAIRRKEQFDTVLTANSTLIFYRLHHQIRVGNLEQKVQLFIVIAECYARAVACRTIVRAGQCREQSRIAPILRRSVNRNRSARDIQTIFAHSYTRCRAARTEPRTEQHRCPIHSIDLSHNQQYVKFTPPAHNRGKAAQKSVFSSPKIRDTAPTARPFQPAFRLLSDPPPRQNRPPSRRR